MSTEAPARHTYDVAISVSGTALSDELLGLLISVVVDDSAEQADLFELRFRDADRTVLDAAGFRLGTEVAINLTTGQSVSPIKLLEGEITALESDYAHEIGSVSVVRGFDQSHRLFRGRTNKNYMSVKASDVVSTIASRNGLSAQVDATTTVYQHISQANESDWQFLQRLALKNGRVLAVTGRKLSFKKPGTAPGAPIELKAHESLLRARVALSTAEQVKKVVARSYDAMEEKELVAEAPVGATVSKPGKVLTAVQGGSKVTQQLTATIRPMFDAGEATAAAKTLSEQIAEGYVELHGETFGNPDLRSGSKVAIVGMGTSFDGTYVVTSTRHVFNGTSAYTTEFAVTGGRDDSFVGLAAAAPAASSQTVQGVMVAVVTDNNDPQKVGRVKVKIPALGADFESFWAPVLYPGAGGKGSGRGLMVVPEVGDHVLVAFEQGDVNRPYVLGAFYTNKQKPPHDDYVNNGKITGRKLAGENGDHILIDQATGKESITISSNDGKVLVKLGTGSGADKRVIQIETDSDVVVKAGRDAKIEAVRDVSVENTGSLTVKSVGEMNVESQGALSLKGATVKIEGTGPVEVKGAVIKLN